MNLSSNTKAILLLTAPLIIGKNTVISELLTYSEYRALAKRLYELKYQPSDLLGLQSQSVIAKCTDLIKPERLIFLLGRGMLLSQVIEHWCARSIWIVSRADKDYPNYFKQYFGEYAPPIIYGCGNKNILNKKGIVFANHIYDSTEIEKIAIKAAKQAANDKISVILVGGGSTARDIIDSTLEAGGSVCCALVQGLEQEALNRKNRDGLMSGKLAFVSINDPLIKLSKKDLPAHYENMYAFANRSLLIGSSPNNSSPEVMQIDIQADQKLLRESDINISKAVENINNSDKKVISNILPQQLIFERVIDAIEILLQEPKTEAQIIDYLVGFNKAQVKSWLKELVKKKVIIKSQDDIYELTGQGRVLV